MTWSMNEAEALAKKAARGAGMSWGLAEEAGKATRSLLELGIDATGPLADLLTLHDGAAFCQISPMDTRDVWRADGGSLCPIAAGSCLTDVAADLANAPITLGLTAFPMFLVPFAQIAARQLKSVVRLDWLGAQIEATQNAVYFGGTLDALTLADVDNVTYSITSSTLKHALPSVCRATISDDIAARLTAFAHRTYAPATDASRLAGAGAGLSDND